MPVPTISSDRARALRQAAAEFFYGRCRTPTIDRWVETGNDDPAMRDPARLLEWLERLSAPPPPADEGDEAMVEAFADAVADDARGDGSMEWAEQHVSSAEEKRTALLARMASLRAEAERLRALIPTCTRGPKACDLEIAEKDATIEKLRAELASTREDLRIERVNGGAMDECWREMLAMVGLSEMSGEAWRDRLPELARAEAERDSLRASEAAARRERDEAIETLRGERDASDLTREIDDTLCELLGVTREDYYAAGVEDRPHAPSVAIEVVKERDSLRAKLARVEAVGSALAEAATGIRGELEWLASAYADGDQFRRITGVLTRFGKALAEWRYCHAEAETRGEEG